MKEIKKEFLIAYDKEEKTIATMEVEVKHPRYWSKEKGSYTDESKYDFSASFNVGELVNIDEENENAYDYYEECFEYGYDAEGKLDLLYGGDRTKKDVIDEWIHYEYDYRERIDCGCTDYEFTFDNVIYNFRTAGCGQHDIRDDTNEWQYVNKAVAELLNIWDEWHLKELTETSYKKLVELLEDMKAYESDDAIIDIAKKNFFE